MKLIFFLILSVTGLVLYMLFGHNGILKYNELVQIKKDYEIRISAMDDKLQKLRNELELVKKDRAYLEMLIKKELNMRKPGEDIYIINNGKIHSNGTDEKDKRAD